MKVPDFPFSRAYLFLFLFNFDFILDSTFQKLLEIISIRSQGSVRDITVDEAQLILWQSRK